MKKKAKVTKITKMDKKDSYGNTSFIIEFDNSDKGYYTSKDEDQKKFTVNQETEYEIEEKVGAGGKPYNKIKGISDGGGFAGRGGRPAEDPKVKVAGFAMSYTKDLIAAGKVQIHEMEKYYEQMYSLMIKKV